MSALSKYKTYPEYKYSGVEWLGEIPSHWEAKRLSNFFIERREKVSDKDYPALSVTKLGIVPQLETAAKTDAGDNRKLVLKNDFVINSRSDRKGSSGTSPYNGSVSLISIVLEPKNIIPEFAHHLLRSIPFQEEFYRFGKGIVADLWSTNSSEMKNILLPELDKIEQTKIAQFLDHETAKIDQLIEKQQTLIELLKEKRQAVISHAVTKGLDPNVKMKDSGVEWLGEVPEYWKVIKLSNISLAFNGDRGSNYPSGNDFVDEGINFLSANEVSNAKVTIETASKITQKKYNELGGLKIKKGDIIYCLRGAGVGKNGICNFDEGTVSSSLMGIRSVKIDPKYLLLLLSSSAELQQRSVLINGSVSPNLSAENVMGYKFAIPESYEQQKIIEFLDAQISKFDLLTQKAEEQIELMKERRTALISAAVTGKIDVRDWQPEQ